MQLPETAIDAVEQYHKGQEVPAVAIVPGDQVAFWKTVFEILEKFPMPRPSVLSPAVPATPERRDPATGQILEYANPGRPAVVEPARFTYSRMQFSAWCFEQKIAQPRSTGKKAGVDQYDPQDMARTDAIQGAAYAILREGYRNFIERRAPNATLRFPVRRQ